MPRKSGWLIVIALILLTACTFSGGSGETPTPSPIAPGGTVQGLAPVERIDILILESFPVQINVLVFGSLPDGCTQIDDYTQTRDDKTITISLTTTRPAEQACTDALVPYQESIPVEATGLKKGVYTVVVNGVKGTFELQVDNILEETPPAGIQE